MFNILFRRIFLGVLAILISQSGCGLPGGDNSGGGGSHRSDADEDAGEDARLGGRDTSTGRDTTATDTVVEAGTEDTSCVRACGDRVCGPDPVCDLSCGPCDGVCTSAGQCEPASEGAPEILSLTSNVSVMTSGVSLIISAIVTDPDGIDDLIGGVLSDPSTAQTYGTFSTSASEGAYSLTLSWSAINTVQLIEFPPGGGPRTFRAEFYDSDGNYTNEDLVITLMCSTETLAACSGSCVDLQTSWEHCGDCDNGMPDGVEAECNDGVASWPTWTDTAGSTCNALCAADGGQCSERDWSDEGECGIAEGCAVYADPEYYYYWSYVPITCSDTISANSDSLVLEHAVCGCARP